MDNVSDLVNPINNPLVAGFLTGGIVFISIITLTILLVLFVIIYFHFKGGSQGGQM